YVAGTMSWALKVAKEMKREREILLSKSRSFTASLRADGWDVSERESQIIPVIIGSNEDAMDAARFLQERGFAIRAIRPPTVPESSARLRLSLTARISANELERLRECLNDWRKLKERFIFANHMAARA